MKFGGRGKVKESTRMPTILKYITSVHVEEINKSC
jgi:hypothetical protein